MIRRARPEDAEAIAALQLRAWRYAYGDYVAAEHIERPLAERVERWRGNLDGGLIGVTLVSEDAGGRLEGFVSVGPSRDEDLARDGAGEVLAIYLDPDVVGTGVGTALLERGEELLAGEHAEASLWVLEPNVQARTFYERHGWVEDDGPYDRGRWDWAPSIRYRKRLR